MKMFIWMFTGMMFCLTLGLPWFVCPHWYQALGCDGAILFLTSSSFLSGTAAS